MQPVLQSQRVPRGDSYVLFSFYALLTSSHSTLYMVETWWMHVNYISSKEKQKTFICKWTAPWQKEFSKSTISQVSLIQPNKRKERKRKEMKTWNNTCLLAVALSSTCEMLSLPSAFGDYKSSCLLHEKNKGLKMVSPKKEVQVVACNSCMY